MNSKVEQYNNFLQEPSFEDIIQILQDFPKNFAEELLERNITYWLKRKHELKSQIKKSIKKVISLPSEQKKLYLGIIAGYFKPEFDLIFRNLRRLYQLKLILEGKKNPFFILKKSIRNLSIVEVAEKLGFTLKREGKIYKTLCPFHNDSKPSLALYPETNTYYCFSCGAYGDALNLLIKVRNCSFKKR